LLLHPVPCSLQLATLTRFTVLNLYLYSGIFIAHYLNDWNKTCEKQQFLWSPYATHLRASGGSLSE
jgi:hypothetical protein